MQLTLRERLSQFTHLTLTTVFERLSEEVPAGRGPLGRPQQYRFALATAFVARAIYKNETTRKLIERLHTDKQLRGLCGWNSPRHIPHESNSATPENRSHPCATLNLEVST